MRIATTKRKKIVKADKEYELPSAADDYVHKEMKHRAHLYEQDQRPKTQTKEKARRLKQIEKGILKP